MALYFITGSKHKLAEIREVITGLEQLDIDLPEIQEIDSRKIIEAKLAEARKHESGALMVEDTSLYFDALHGLPGPLIKWFMKTVGNEGLYKMAAAFGDFGAEAKTVIGYAAPEGAVRFFEGSIKGTIVSPRGESDFGWDPIFQPDGYQETFAELGSAVKNSLSMRRLAAEQLQKHLASL